MLTTQLYPTPALQLPVTGVTNRIQATTVSLPALQFDRVEFGARFSGAGTKSRVAQQDNHSQAASSISSELQTYTSHTPITATLVSRIQAIPVNNRSQIELVKVKDATFRPKFSALLDTIRANEKLKPAQQQSAAQIANDYNTQHGLVKKD
jgi:hypothetical protein